ncbi:MAG: phosphatase PAP2 family protein [Fidelibacterota bacterium]
MNEISELSCRRSTTRGITTISLVLLFLFPRVLFAQDRFSSISDYFTETPALYWSGCRYTVQDRSNQWIWGVATVGTVLAFQVDTAVQNYAQKHGLLPERWARFGDDWGGGWAYAFLYPTVFATSRMGGDSWSVTARKLELASFTFGTTAALTSFLKRVVGRERPNHRGYRSFPSGHTSGSFAFAGTIDELYGHGWGSLAYGVATLVGISRVHDNKHYLSDVIFGAALGTTIARGFARAFRSEKIWSSGKVSSLFTGDQIVVMVTIPLD